jgi:putative membrane protein
MKLFEQSAHVMNLKHANVISLGLLSIFFSVGVLGHSLPQTFDLMIQVTPWVLFISAGLVLYISLAQDSVRGPIKPHLLWICICYVITFALEAIGVTTGFVFGSYTYGHTLGLQVFNTPLVIGLNWVIVILGITVAVKQIVNHPILVSFLVGIFAVVFDVILEPLAMDRRMDYWSWEGGVVPVHNYIAWFMISFVFALAYVLRVKTPMKSWILPGYWIIQTIFFIAIRAFALGV